MRTPLPLLALVSVCLAACAAKQPTRTQEAAAEAKPEAVALSPAGMDDGFRVRMPGTPQVVRNKVAIPAGDVLTGAYTANVDGVIYSVSYTDYPQKVVSSRPPTAFLDEGRNGLVNQLKGTLRDEAAVQLQGHPGRSYTVVSDNGTVRARNFMVGPRLYTLLVLFNPSVGAPQADAFLESLELLPSR
jgi:hypothetical protein